MYIRRNWLMIGTLLLFFSFLLHPDIVSASVEASMERFCLELIPILFPYMVLSHIFCTYRLLDPVSVLFPVGKLFHIDKSAFTVFSLGQICGYPVGASLTASLVENKQLSSKQGALLCAASAGASPPFLLHIVGGAYWGDIRFGMGLYLLQVLFGLAAGWLLGKKIPSQSVYSSSEQTIPFAQCFTEAVGGSALRIVSIGGYIVFFSLLISLLPQNFPLTLPLAALLEFSEGTRIAAQYGGDAGLFWTGFSAGFGGLSIFCQMAQMLSSSQISLLPTVCCKGISGLLCGIYALVVGSLLKLTPTAENMCTGLFSQTSIPIHFLMLLLMAMVLWLAPKRTKRTHGR